MLSQKEADKLIAQVKKAEGDAGHAALFGTIDQVKTAKRLAAEGREALRASLRPEVRAVVDALSNAPAPEKQERD